MNFLEKLLDGVAVEWKTLGDVTLPTSNIKWRDTSRSYRYIDLTSVSIERKAITATLEIASNNAPSRAQKLVEKDDLIFATTRPAQQRYCLINEQYAGEVASTGYCVLRAKKNEVLPKWILHWIASSKFKNYVEENQSGSAYPAISDARVKEFKIPVPCPENPKKSLEIQAEIVRILDTFTELTAELTTELTTELTARKKQYNHYRDQLLSFEDGEVEWRTHGDLCSIGVGRAPVGNEIGEYAFVNAGTTPSGFVAAYNTEPDTITTPSRGQGGIGYVGYQTTRFWCGPLCYRIRSTSELLSTRFLYHFTANSMKEIIGLANMTGVPALNKKDLVGFLVPMPSPAEQERIVAILDKFDALTNSITEGLPREIALRQRQYEYYRDLLLSFPKPASEMSIESAEK
ncbi:restriction endonuclease subunit S [Rhodoferax antarcticus]|uniref:restriction endonuclease subunit S n=1 Tax=Rhodoferax antarcticus TaxID=81479 RepID=UPI00222598CB|nr:restriction endonuclease subunit S [Rhodoferax antarcticus]MCW2312904.1 type I restriction enzyme S subunit [Rhodoferax antarcticus]